jgi:hypothetical protein
LPDCPEYPLPKICGIAYHYPPQFPIKYPTD